jgi:hypothetical protein
MPLQIRRGTAAERSSLTIPLVIGELLYVTDQGKLYIGDGTSIGSADIAGNPSQGGKGLIITGFTTEEAQDATNTLFSNGTHTNINFTYNDAANSLSAAVDLSSYTGNITVNGTVDADFRGSVFADNSTLLVDAVSGTIPYSVLSGAPTLVSHFTNDAGYLTAGDLGGASSFVADIKGSVFADDSSIIVDAVSNVVSTSQLNTNRIEASGFGLSVLTPSGSVILGSTSNDINSNLFINRTEFTGDTTAGVTMSQSHSFSYDTDGLNFNRSRGSLSSPAIVQNGDTLGKITFLGYNNNPAGGSLGYFRSMLLRVTSEFINSNTITSNLNLLSANPSGTVVPRMRFSSDGRLLLGPNLITDPVGERVGIEIYQTLNAGTDSSIGQPITIRQYFDGVDANNFTIERYRGTRSVQNAVLSGDRIFDFSFRACDGGGTNSVATSSRIGFIASGTIASGIVPGTISFDTADQTGTLQERVQIREDGILYALYGIEGDVTGSVFSDSSTMLIDGTSGSLMMANVNMVGQTGNIPVTPGTVDSWLEVRVNGNTKYVPLYV